MIDPGKVREVLAELDGSAESAVRLLTGLSPEQIEELGGLPPENSS